MAIKTAFDGAALSLMLVGSLSGVIAIFSPAPASAQLNKETPVADTLTKQAGPIQGGVSRFAAGSGVTAGGAPFDLESEHPIPDEMVQKYVMPLLWVKIPKAFAGIWETRTETVLGGLSVARVSVVENGKLTEGPAQVAESPSSFVAVNKYRFIRGVQIDEHGDIWDCPSLSNFQQRQLSMGNIVVTKTWAITERNILSIKDDEMVDELTRNSMAVANPAFSISSVRMHIDRRLINPSQVDASWSFSFGKSGNEALGETLLIPEYKIAEFKPVDRWHGIDLKASLKDFIQKK